MFLSNISHDMRTPLNSIIGFLSLARDVEDAEEKNLYLDKISISAKYLLGLINDTLDLSKLETGKIQIVPERTDPAAIIENIVETIRPSAEAKHISLNVDFKNLLPVYVMVDTLRIQELFLNILTNAVKFTPEYGTIEAKIKVLSLQGKKVNLKISVSDTGIGMSKEFQKQIFEPFTQENPYVSGNYTGSGLGMSIAKQIVEIRGRPLLFICSWSLWGKK
jgi:signal transduction histidine kinase